MSFNKLPKNDCSEVLTELKRQLKILAFAVGEVPEETERETGDTWEPAEVHTPANSIDR